MALYRSCVNISKMHNCGPYGNVVDRHVQHYIGFPLLNIKSYNSTLSGEDRVKGNGQQVDNWSHQDGWSSELNSAIKSLNTDFDRNMGFVVHDTLCADLPVANPIEMNNSNTYLQLVDKIIQSGVPKYKLVHVPFQSSFNWEFLKQNTLNYHDKALIDYIKFGFPLGLAHNQ